MRSLIVIGILPILCSCTTVSTDTKQYYSSRPGMSEDAQDFPNTKYNLMDSSDGQNDPTTNIKIWSTKY